MNYITVNSSKPGTPPPKLEKRTNDSRIYWLDCSAMLAQGELITGVIEYKCSDELIINEYRTKKGRYVQFRISGGPTDMPFIEYPVRFSVSTTAGNIISVPLTLKVYSD